MNYNDIVVGACGGDGLAVVMSLHPTSYYGRCLIERGGVVAKLYYESGSIAPRVGDRLRWSRWLPCDHPLESWLVVRAPMIPMRAQSLMVSLLLAARLRSDGV